MHIPFIVFIRRTIAVCNVPKIMSSRRLSHLSMFRDSLKAAKQVVIVSGEDISSESGLPIYDKSGHWRKYQTSSLTTSGAFLTFPSLVWEFYHYRRELTAKATPNEAHKAIAQFEEKYGGDKSITVITQSVDGLHAKAGTKNLIEVHGNLFKTRCIKCNDVVVNNDSPICEALANKGSPDEKEVYTSIPEKDLPHCHKPSCSGLVRPDVVWFGESIDPSVVEKTEQAISTCDMCLVIGSPSLLFPAAMYAPEALNQGAIVAEFNQFPDRNSDFHYFFEGPCSKTIPEALDLES